LIQTTTTFVPIHDGNDMRPSVQNRTPVSGPGVGSDVDDGSANVRKPHNRVSTHAASSPSIGSDDDDDDINVKKPHAQVHTHAASSPNVGSDVDDDDNDDDDDDVKRPRTQVRIQPIAGERNAMAPHYLGPRPIVGERPWRLDSGSGRINFHVRDQFGLYNMRRKTCLTRAPSRMHHGQETLKSERCNIEQRFVRDTRLAFHWKPAENNLMYLASYNDAGGELCATIGHGVRHGVTYFHPCSPSSTKYSLTSTMERGFKIRAADKSNQCLEVVGRHGTNMWRCGSFSVQQFQKVDIL